MLTVTVVLCVLVQIPGLLQFTNAVSTNESYNLTLSNSGPVMIESLLTFQAKLQLQDETVPVDEKHFIYTWESTANSTRTTTFANFNSCIDMCHPEIVKPGNYEMTVTVHELVWHKIATQTQEFIVIDHLNGILTAHQTEKLPVPTAQSNFSTEKPVTLKVNLTDSFQHSPEKTFIWYIDGNKAGSNDPTLTQMFALGNRKVKVNVKTSKDVIGCDGVVYKNSLTGEFKTNFLMKDPVSAVEIRGRVKDIPASHPETFYVSFNGSGPFHICWSILDDENGTSSIVSSNCSANVDKPGGYNITIYTPHTNGHYMLNVSVKNDVSAILKHKNISIGHKPPRQPLPSVAVPVIGCLLAICAITAGVVYVLKLPKKKERSETADFDFHPSLLNSNNSINNRSRNGSVIDSIKPKLLYIRVKFHRLLHRDKHARDHQRARYLREMTEPTYGSMDLVESVDLTV